MTSSDYAIQAVKGIKESFDNAIQNKIEQYRDSRIMDFYTTSEISEIFTSTEGMTGAKELSELETPPSMKLEDGYSVTISEKRFGGAIVVPEKVYRRDANDPTIKVGSYVQRQRNQLLLDNTNLFLTNAFAMLNGAFNSSSSYLAPDGVELCGIHIWKSGGTFTNKDTALLTSSAIDTMEEYAGAFTDPSGKHMPLNLDTIIVKKGTANAREAKKLFANKITPIAVADINIYMGEYIIIETPYISTAYKNCWFARSSMIINSMAVGIGEYPVLREPLKEANEAVRTNCTGFWKQGIINMPFDWYGSYHA